MLRFKGKEVFNSITANVSLKIPEPGVIFAVK